MATRPWVRAVGLVVAVAVSAWSFQRVPHASLLPAVLGLLPWMIGKYILCPLRWHSLSLSGARRWWHVRRYAESELLGLASPGHVGADLWRIHTLHDRGMARSSAVTEVGLDRLVGAIGLAVFVVASGSMLPPRVMIAALAIAAVLVVGGLVVRRMKPSLIPNRPMPAPRVVAKGVLLSMGYQLSIIGLLVGTVEAMGSDVSPLPLLGVFGASQVAGIIPGINGASPREGALVVGLASLGVTWSAALGAVALTALLAWVPALLLGGASLSVRRWQRHRRVAIAAAA
ncbi:MAG: hypothetical protein ACXV3C_08725 [Actinomycetes bacterium]